MATDKTTKQTLSVRLPVKTHQHLDTIKEVFGDNTSEAVERAINYLKDNLPAAIEQDKQTRLGRADSRV